MAIKELVESFNSYNNPDLIFNQGNEFLLAQDVDANSIPKYARDTVSSYDNIIFLNLKNKFRDYLDSNFLLEKIPEYQKENFFVESLPGVDQRYRRIFYYALVDIQDLEQKITFTDIGSKLINGITKLDFEATEEDKNTIIRKSIPTFGKFTDWYMCVYESSNSQKSPIKGGIDNVLKFLSKKGSWILESQNIKEISKKSLNNVYVQTVPKKTIVDLENEIILFFDKNNLFDENNTMELLYDNLSPYNNLSIFYKYYIDDNGKQNYLFGFPKVLIDEFPNLSVAVDVQEFQIDLEVTYTDFSDAEKSFQNLKNKINKKNDSLEESGLKISNYDLDYYLKDVENFISSLSDSLNEQKIDLDANLTFKFTKTQCTQPQLTNNSEVDNINNSVYKKCLEEYVDGQTNLTLVNVKSNKKIDVNFSSLSIDKNLSSYLFANSKNIFNQSDSYTAKNFFSKLIYEKTKFEKKDNLILQTFMTQAETSFQQSFVQDAANFIKFSKIKQNIQKQNLSDKSLSQIIKDVLNDIHSLKQLYQTILFRYDLKDLADELISCFLEKNPNLNKLSELIAETNALVEGLVKLLDYKDPNYIKFVQCTGLSVPFDFANVNPNNIESIYNKEQLTNQIKKRIDSITDDYVETTIIKCANEFAPEAAKNLINTYIQSEAARKILKQQYDQLVLEAKLYKSNPGTKDGLKKKGKSFLSVAARNAWTLLQRQAEQEAEKIIKKAAIQIIKDLLKEANTCKKDSNKKKNSGKPGDVQLNSNFSNQDINNLLSDLSKFYSPEQLCSLFYGSADDELYKSILEFIKTRHNKLYSQAPIKIDSVIISQNPLSSIFAVKNFFIVLSTEKKELQAKCDQYFQSLNNSPVDINDDEKCIDFSNNYRQNKKRELTNKGFTEQQAEKIIENEKNLQAEKYKNLQDITQKGIYNEITAEEENHTFPAADFVKNKINKQLKALVNSFSSFVDSYKIELLNLSYSNLGLYELKEEDVYYDFIKSSIYIKGENILFKDTNDPNFYNSVEPLFKYLSFYTNLPYTIAAVSDKYFLLSNSNQTQLESVMKQVYINAESQLKVDTNLFQFNAQQLEYPEYWTQPFSNSLFYYADQIRQSFILQLLGFQTNEFNKDKMLNDVRELIYFEE